MNAEVMRNIKSAIKDLKHERSFVKSLEKNIVKRYDAKIKDLDLKPSDYFDAKTIATLDYEESKEIYKLYQDFGMDISIHIIYSDGSECCTDGAEIVSGINPVLQNIAYACYSDAYTQYDTLTGCLDNMFQHGENAEELDEYFSMIEIKFNTAWGKCH